MTPEQEIQLDVLSAYTGRELTAEQKEFASDFTKDTLSFSDPGTGKTHTLVLGLLMAQTYHKVPGNLINCMSFTNAAVSEMAGRYEQCCKRRGITPTVKFNTFHSLSNAIMRDAFPSMRIVKKTSVKDDIEYMSRYLSEEGVDVSDKNYVKKVIKAVNSLNSSLTFHPDNVATKYDFVCLDLDIDIFQNIRKRWFLRGITFDTIVQGDIPLYCLYALMKKESIIEKWKGRYKIMVVDEFQDMSLLHLRILSYIANTLIVIGDMKQQIYAFNGACPQIVDEYLKLHSDARVCNLTHSFRCSNIISKFATRLIKPNDATIEEFTGTDVNSHIQFVERRNMDWEKIAENIEADMRKNTIGRAIDVMFLYRNNSSCIPIIEQLYKLGVPFRCTKFTSVMEIPIFDHLCAWANAAWQPSDVVKVEEALRKFPEFKYLQYGQVPGPILLMNQTGKSLFEIKWKYKENSSYEILNAMMIARKKIEEGKNASIVLNNLLGVYDRHVIKGQWWQLDNEKEFYFNLVGSLLVSKDYPTMYNEEIDKAARNVDCINAGMGVRCYTMHTAKGLEADDVYILDCDEGIFPNARALKLKYDAGCIYDAACDIRAERNLLYVAVTRAKRNVTISYSSEKPASIIALPDSSQYEEYDRAYENHTNDFDDATEFFKLFKLES